MTLSAVLNGKMMDDEFERIWKEAVMAESRYYPSIFLREGSEENHEKPQSGTAVL
jgi:hypothetical protein